MSAALPILNISSYKFVGLNDCAALRETLYQRALALGLKGTVLLAEEGINLFLAGTAEAVRGWVAQLKADQRFADLDPKESWSEAVPFKKLLVKVKREIIRMDMPTVRPDQAARPPAVTPETLSRWLDQGVDDAGRPVVMLDTRNDFEVDYGTFDNAIDWRIKKFTEFPGALADHLDELRGKTVVSFCTGGIRCEKATIVLEQQALDGPVYQLEGGILRYFELAGGKHYHGSCFVFDQREALDAGLHTPADLQRPASEAHRG
ncbi:sulfurtransferase [Paucibacter sp. JuS9]|uniref:sulfurtransferase n=1 Tax=Paucibacter sp. JuS9 TaxID=3228748 RepID=UPI0037583776